MLIKLIHVRENKNEIELERKAVLRTSGVREDELVSIDFLNDDLGLDDLGCDALIVGGSRFGVADNDQSLRLSNLNNLVNFVKEAEAQKIPYLGLCFGAQLLAYALGGEVLNDKEKEERGTFEIFKASEALVDPLFKDLPEKFMAQCAHHDYITRLPQDAVLLATSALCPVHAFRVGGMYGLQFHPERSKEDYEEIIKLRFKDHGTQEQYLKNLFPSKESETIVKTFVDIFVRQKIGL